MKITPKFDKLSGVTIELTAEEVRVIGINATATTNSYMADRLIRAIIEKWLEWVK